MPVYHNVDLNANTTCIKCLIDNDMGIIANVNKQNEVFILEQWGKKDTGVSSFMIGKSCWMKIMNICIMIYKFIVY